MALSTINVCNMALSALGADAIVSMEENNKPARQCSIWIQPCIESILSDAAFPWSFATARATLAQLGVSPGFGWTYAYQLPADYLSTQLVNGTRQGTPHEIEGTTLVTDAEEVELVYTNRLTDPSRMSMLACRALACLMAASMANVVTGSAKRRVPDLLEEYAMWIDRARLQDARKGTDQAFRDEMDADDDWVTSRES